MDKWKKFAKEMLDFVVGLDVNKIQFLSYAITYAQYIIPNIDLGKKMGDSPEKATKTQMLYMISNLEGADESDLLKIEEMCKEVGVDISDAIKEIIEEKE